MTRDRVQSGELHHHLSQDEHLRAKTAASEDPQISMAEVTETPLEICRSGSVLQQNSLLGAYILWLHVGNQEDKKWKTKQNTVLVLEKHLSEFPVQL